MTTTDPWLDAIGDADPDLVAHVLAARDQGGALAHAGELCLAFRASRGEPAAVRELVALVAPDIDDAARKIDRAPAFVDEIRQQVRVRLLTGDPPRLAGYLGRGPLRGWVGVVALRVALNAKRGPRVATDDVLGELIAGEPDPELRHMKSLYRAEFRDALAAALAALDDRPRALLRLAYVDGVKLAQIGRLYRVHESTASRWLAQATEAVAAATRERLVAKLAISPASLDSLTRMVASQLDLSIARLLGGPRS